MTLHTIDYIGQARPLMTDINEHTLILIDVDSTLITATDPYLRRDAFSQFSLMFKNRTQNLSHSDMNTFLHLLVMESPSRLMECDFIPFIQSLQQQKALVLACTATQYDKIGNVFFPDYRYAELNDLGVNLTQSIHHRNITNTTLRFSSDAGMDKGIIYTGSHHDKGYYLDQILDVIRFIPKKIIIIDDEIDHINAITKAALRYYKIPVLGVHYTRLSSVASAHLDKEVFNNKINKILGKIYLYAPLPHSSYHIRDGLNDYIY